MSRSKPRLPDPPKGPWEFNTGFSPRTAAMTVADDAIAGWLGSPIPPAVADLVEVLTAVQFVDRVERRPVSSRGGDSWVRELCLVVGVRNPNMWRARDVSQRLRNLLVWLTDDDWNIEFVPREAPDRPSESIQFLFPHPVEGDAIALYSGGLDSFAGVALDLAEGIPPVLVSIVSNNRQGASQSETLDSFRNTLGITLQRVAVQCHLRGVESKEPSHRTRGFGFLGVAAAVAAMSDIGTVRVYENGIGAINLPYSRAQVGAQSTRSMHPETLRRAAGCFSAVLGRPIVFVNINQYRTKGEMCRRMPAELQPVVPLVRSCDMAYAHRASTTPNCGVCTSCLLRRQALWGANLGAVDQETKYRRDVLEEEIADGEAFRPLKSMLAQAARLETALSSSSPWRSLLNEFPEMLDAFEALDHLGPVAAVRAQMVGMYERYVSEFRSFPVPIAPAYLPSKPVTFA